MRGSKDCSGRNVDLLNSEVHPAATPSPSSSGQTLPSYHNLINSIPPQSLSSGRTEHSPRSSTSSSTRSLSPPSLRSSKSSISTISLERHASMASDYSYDAMDQSKTLVPNDTYLQQGAQFYSPMPQAQAAMQPPYYTSTRHTNDINREFQYIPDRTLEANLQFHAPEPHAMILSHDQQLASAPTNPTNALQKIHKKKYPCPHREEYKCPDTFTTSGHAARHGKKHTGEKNVTCPQCGKAFTRKDNMKQHERTHDREKDKSTSKTSSSSNITQITQESGRPAKLARSRSRSSTAPPTPFIEQQSEIANTKTDATDLHSLETTPRLMRPQMRIQMPETFNFAQPARSAMDEAVISGSSGEDCEGESPGLDALAFVPQMSA